MSDPVLVSTLYTTVSDHERAYTTSPAQLRDEDAFHCNYPNNKRVPRKRTEFTVYF